MVDDRKFIGAKDALADDEATERVGDAAAGVANDVGVAGREQIQREIDLRRLRTGDYILEVTVSASGDRQAVRRQEFSIVR